MILSADDSLCCGENCPLKECCLRATQKSVYPDRQWYTEPLYDKDKKSCILYIENEV